MYPVYFSVWFSILKLCQFGILFFRLLSLIILHIPVHKRFIFNLFFLSRILLLLNLLIVLVFYFKESIHHWVITAVLLSGYPLIDFITQLIVPFSIKLPRTRLLFQCRFFYRSTYNTPLIRSSISVRFTSLTRQHVFWRYISNPRLTSDQIRYTVLCIYHFC